MTSEPRSFNVIVSSIFARRKSISLENLCLLADYISVADSDCVRLLPGLLDRVFPPEISLFDLSKYFFARKPEYFFRIWASVADFYGELFWVAYWSDILWRAYNVVRLQKMGLFAEAKKYSARLPFSFIQGGWRNIDENELKEAHHHISLLDNDIKHGMQGLVYIELMYLKFFSQELSK